MSNKHIKLAAALAVLTFAVINLARAESADAQARFQQATIASDIGANHLLIANHTMETDPERAVYAVIGMGMIVCAGVMRLRRKA